MTITGGVVRSRTANCQDLQLRAFRQTEPHAIQNGFNAQLYANTNPALLRSTLHVSPYSKRFQTALCNFRARTTYARFATERHHKFRSDSDSS